MDKEITKQYCSISVDMDPLDHYLSARGFEPLPHTNLNAVYDDALPRFLDIFDKYGVKATFFIVGKDLENKENCKRIRVLSDRGHEVANHTYSHFQYFFQLDPKNKKEEIENADKMISDVTGRKVVGFRAPGWGIDAITLKILEKNNYTYDSSVFPSKILSIIGNVNWILNKGKLKRSLGSSWKVGMAPKLPYRPDDKKIWKKGKMSIIEIPPTVLPIVQMPFLVSTLYMFGKAVFNLSHSFFWIFQRPLFYELHGIELVDYYSEINDERLLMKPGLGKTIDKKKELYYHFLSKFSKKYEFITMEKVETLFQI